MPDRCLLRLLTATLVALAAAPPASAAGVSYGEIEVAPETEPRGNPSHGYTEYRFLVKNRSSDRAAYVRLEIPGDTGRRTSGNITSLARTVEVAPGGVTSVSLLQPSSPDVAGGGVAVYINGRKQETQLAIPIVSGYSPHGSMYPRRRGRSYGYPMYGSSSGIKDALILSSLRIPEEFFKHTVIQFPPAAGAGGPGMPAAGGAPGMAAPAPAPLPPAPPAGGAPPGARPAPAAGEPAEELEPGMAPGAVAGGVPTVVPRPGMQVLRSDLPVSIWSSNWLAYSRYDGIVLTTEDLDDLRRAGTESRAVLQALWQYAETGGVLLILGNGKKTPQVAVPAAYLRLGIPLEGLMVYSIGFGRCLVAPDRDKKKWTEERWRVAQASFNQTTASTWRNARGITELNTNFPVVDDLGVPVKGLFALMVLFAVTMGPVNLVLLSRHRRRIWLLWTVPALSLVFCLAVLGYMVVAEGWQGHSRIAGLTLLDEVEKRATTIGRAAFYSPLTPSDGLHFSDVTEVQLLGVEHSAWSNSCTLDWTNDQHLSRGWIAARVPSYFAVRKSEPLRRERLNLRREGDGGLSVVNALGTDITQLWLADEKGGVYRADAISAGGSAKLSRAGTLAALAQPKAQAQPEGMPPGMAVPGGAAAPETPPGDPLRQLYSVSDWVVGMKNMQAEPYQYLRPGTYLAVVESSPFLEPGLKDAQARPSPSIVLGVMADLAGKR